jgi:hypothetical protein
VQALCGYVKEEGGSIYVPLLADVSEFVYRRLKKDEPILLAAFQAKGPDRNIVKVTVVPRLNNKDVCDAIAFGGTFRGDKPIDADSVFITLTGLLPQSYPKQTLFGIQWYGNWQFYEMSLGGEALYPYQWFTANGFILTTTEKSQRPNIPENLSNQVASQFLHITEALPCHCSIVSSVF